MLVGIVDDKIYKKKKAADSGCHIADLASGAVHTLLEKRRKGNQKQSSLTPGSKHIRCEMLKIMLLFTFSSCCGPGQDREGFPAPQRPRGRPPVPEQGH